MEEWRNIEGYEGYYEVSSKGNVRGVDRTVNYSDGRIRFINGKEKTKTLNEDGYYTVKLSKDGVDKRIAVHILVAKAFIDGYKKGLEVNHKDFNRINNNADNLEWVTHRENLKILYDNGRGFVQTHDVSGKNNPNFGNHKLSEIYKNNKEYAKEKCSRPGAKNGMSKPVRMILNDGSSIDFSYLTECAQYLIDNGISKSNKAASLTHRISSAAKNNTQYLNNRFEFI